MSATPEHLGGASLDTPDRFTFMPDVWKRLVEKYAVKSVLDVGCGAGWATEAFRGLALDAHGVEGDPAALARLRVPSECVTRHDYEAGPFVPEKTYDLAWVSEFVEHVEACYEEHWFATLSKCRYVCMTFATPGQGGHHHVNERPEEYWIERFRKHGFILNRGETDALRATSKGEPWGRRTLTFFKAVERQPGEHVPPERITAEDERIASTFVPRVALTSKDVAVVIPCFRQAQFLPDAVASVRMQTLPPKEIVVVAGDDASYDAAWALEVAIVRDPGYGLAHARNVGIAGCVSPLIFPLDADDTIAPDCLAKMVALAEHDLTIVASDMQEFGERNGQLLVRGEMLAKGYTSPMCLFTRRLWKLTGGYDVASPIEDWAFWLDCHAFAPTLHHVPETLVRRRMHAAQSTQVDPYELFMSVDRYLRPARFARTEQDECHVRSSEIQAWVTKRLDYFPDNAKLKSLVRKPDGPVTLGLCMIVKDEIAVLARCLRSVKPWISHWTVVDTGSTDGTQDLVRAELAGIPGELHERPWVDFATNRNEAFDLAKGHTSHVLVIDADDELVVDPAFAWPPNMADVGYVRVEHGGIVHRRAQVTRSDLPVRYRGVLHEWLDVPQTASGIDVHGMTVKIHGGGARSCHPRKFERDAEVLEREILKDPKDGRTAFYLAQSYRDAWTMSGEVRHLVSAWINYRARVALGGFDEEVFWSRLESARAYETLGDRIPGWKHEDVAAFYLEAYRFRPHRAEPLWSLARFLRGRNEYALAAAYARAAAALPKPTTERLWIEPAVYDWWALDEFTVSASYIPALRPEAAEACHRLLTVAPPWEIERVKRTLGFCLA